MDGVAIQDYLVRNGCWGCGSANVEGLHLKSYRSGDEYISTWRPSEYHMAGPKQFLNGGIIATVIDCHSICSAIADAYEREEREMDTDPLIWYVTASIKIDYLRPTPIGEAVTLRARVKEIKDRKSTVSCTLWSMNEERVRAEVIAVRVAADEWYGE